jgi:hypothetical protein
MTRAFPFALSIGTDICKISRINAILQGKRAVQFWNKVLNYSERKVYDHKFEVIKEYKALKATKNKLPPDSEKVMNDRLWILAAFVSGRSVYTISSRQR